MERQSKPLTDQKRTLVRIEQALQYCEVQNQSPEAEVLCLVHSLTQEFLENIERHPWGPSLDGESNLYHDEITLEEDWAYCESALSSDHAKSCQEEVSSRAIAQRKIQNPREWNYRPTNQKKTSHPDCVSRKRQKIASTWGRRT